MQQPHRSHSTLSRRSSESATGRHTRRPDRRYSSNASRPTSNRHNIVAVDRDTLGAPLSAAASAIVKQLYQRRATVTAATQSHSQSGPRRSRRRSNRRTVTAAASKSTVTGSGTASAAAATTVSAGPDSELDFPSVSLCNAYQSHLCKVTYRVWKDLDFIADYRQHLFAPYFEIILMVLGDQSENAAKDARYKQLVRVCNSVASCTLIMVPDTQLVGFPNDILASAVSE
jgi:hypothetical protein